MTSSKVIPASSSSAFIHSALPVASFFRTQLSWLMLISLVYLGLVWPQISYDQFWLSHLRENVDQLKEILRRRIRRIKCLINMTYKESEMELDFLNFKRQASISVLGYVKSSCKSKLYFSCE